MSRVEQAGALGEALHTALRKLCDSTVTSAAYNVVHLVPADDWTRYLAHVDQALAAAAPNTTAWKRALRSASLDFPYMGRPGPAALHCLFKLFSESDWAGYAGYLDYIYGTKAEAP